MAKNNPFSQTVSHFHGLALPEPEMTLVGYSAIINRYDLRLPLPDRLASVSTKHRRYENHPWCVFTPKHMPEDTLAGQPSGSRKLPCERDQRLGVLLLRAGLGDQQWIARSGHRFAPCRKGLGGPGRLRYPGGQADSCPARGS